MSTPAPLGREDARRLTERIRTALDRVSTAWADLAERISEAYQRRADLALGYGSWAEYAEAELKPEHGIAAEVRRQLVAMLAAQGMSTRAIAPTVGVSQQQVSRDQVTHHVSPGVDDNDDEQAGPLGVVISDDTAYDLEDAAAEVATQRAVTGLDGKTYTRPAPSAPRTAPRTPITDSFFNAAYDLNRRAETLHRLVTDDRFPQNAKKIAQKHLNDLLASRDLLQQVIDRLS